LQRFDTAAAFRDQDKSDARLYNCQVVRTNICDYEDNKLLM